MIFMFIVPTPGKVYKERDIWVCIYEKRKEWTKTYMCDKRPFYF